MKKVYRRRRDYLVECLYANFENKIQILGKSAGMHLVVEFKNVNFTPELLNQIKDSGVCLTSVEELSIVKGRHLNQLMLGYAHLSETQILNGVQGIKNAVYNYL